MVTIRRYGALALPIKQAMVKKEVRRPRRTIRKQYITQWILSV